MLIFFIHDFLKVTIFLRKLPIIHHIVALSKNCNLNPKFADSLDEVFLRIIS